ncbi:hypothetical protein KL918_004000 [Ogataea parapolymorpha]|uniref:Protein YOP1 n=1 Tax=Ogataea parapolymorpha (strain ATCC 26012 / BCRC 20466 / JCM 22074 / NRRL Y-7560 / DL-1) TaxID=871575 RepID=W1QB39_OGAPD|nr:hypothetical protein HPODL_03888 [Ogataea parapolymorpha DL-1]ESW98256.1 hypothetical protein HPODL_03888 [Ogataea parapolymorpha DL-1]KAG7866011.1 hypothetical protein KL918_004000 [Ogataea parapolymorpha]KAG7874835.1 hypothetical protein KL916_001079 [Ogataea parapolymorpha]
MFGVLLAAIGVWVSYLYPLAESFKLLTNVDQSRQPIVLPPQSQFQRWFVYWLVLAVCTLVISNRVVRTVLSFVPFSSLVTLYLRIWLVFPLVSVDSSGTSVTGSYILYHHYLKNWLVVLNHYVGDLKTTDVVTYGAGFYNRIIDQYVPNYQFLKLNVASKQDKSTVEVMNELWQSSGWRGSSTGQNVTDYYPQLLFSSLISPIKSMVFNEHKDVRDEYDVVNKDELHSANASTTSLPRLQNRNSSGSLRKVTPSGTDPQNRRPSWGFGWKSRNSSATFANE